SGTCLDVHLEICLDDRVGRIRSQTLCATARWSECWVVPRCSSWPGVRASLYRPPGTKPSLDRVPGRFPGAANDGSSCGPSCACRICKDGVALGADLFAGGMPNRRIVRRG